MEKETLEEAAEKHYEEQSREFENNTDNPIFDTSRYLVAGFIDGAKWQAERIYSEEDMINFAEFVARYPDKNRNHSGQMLHAKSKYDGAERTIDLLQVWFEKFKNK